MLIINVDMSEKRKEKEERTEALIAHRSSLIPGLRGSKPASRKKCTLVK